MACHSLLQWTIFCQIFPPWPDCLGWLSVIELDKAVVLWSDWLAFCDYGFSVSALWCPLATPTILLGFLLARTWGSSSRLLQQRTAIAPYLGGGEKSLGAMNRSFLFLKELTAAGHLPAHLSLSILKHKPKALVQSCLFSCWGFCLLTDTMTAWLLVARTVTGYHLKFYSLTITFHLCLVEVLYVSFHVLSFLWIKKQMEER